MHSLLRVVVVVGHLDVHLVICVDSCATGSAVNSNSQASQVGIVYPFIGELGFGSNGTALQCKMNVCEDIWRRALVLWSMVVPIVG